MEIGERGREALSCRPSAPPEYKWCLGDLVVTRSPTNESLMNVTSQSEGLDEVALQNGKISSLTRGKFSPLFEVLDTRTFERLTSCILRSRGIFLEACVAGATFITFFSLLETAKETEKFGEKSTWPSSPFSSLRVSSFR